MSVIFFVEKYFFIHISRRKKWEKVVKNRKKREIEEKKRIKREENNIRKALELIYIKRKKRGKKYWDPSGTEEMENIVEKRRIIEKEIKGKVKEMKKIEKEFVWKAWKEWREDEKKKRDGV